MASSYGTYYKVNGIAGNAVDDAQIRELLGDEAIGYTEYKYDLPESITQPGNVQAGKDLGSAAQRLAQKVIDIIDGVTSGFSNVFKFVKNYWQFLIIAAVALVIVGND